MSEHERGELLAGMRERVERDHEAPFAWVVVLLAAAAVLWSVLGGGVAAQIERHTSDVEVLARITVHETGWEDTGDMEAIFAVLQTGAAREGISWRAYARRYSRRLHAGEVSRAWASQLTEACTRPSSWPEVVLHHEADGSVRIERHARWGVFRERCFATMERARATVGGERTHGCPSPPDDWGGRVDRARARRLGLVLIDCSLGDVPTVGDYYTRPTRSAP